MHIDIIAGTRPNFIKIASVISAINNLKEHTIIYRLIHTGQHYDANMSELFFKQLEIPEPKHIFKLNAKTQAEQTASIMVQYELLLTKTYVPKICLVVGDVNSTMACAIVAKKAGAKVAHIEAGIRSLDWSMPEEVNRVVTDSITDYFFTTSEFANKNLLSSGIKKDRIFFVGNTMIDTLLKFQSKLNAPMVWFQNSLTEKKFLLLTLHRPANVDNPNIIAEFIQEILQNSENFPIVFPVHPRTKKNLQYLGEKNNRLIITEPLGYLEFNFLTKNALAVITDSGGITEEATVMNVPCLTLRDNTERPETVFEGTNELIGTNPKNIKPALQKLFSGHWKKGQIPKLWDGNTAKRIIEILNKI